MFTSMELDDELFMRAWNLSGQKTKKAFVEEVLRVYLSLHDQAEVRSLRGKLVWQGDLAEQRKGRRAVQALVDASVWLGYFTGEKTPQTDLLDRLLGRSALIVADLTLAEVLCALADEHHRKLASAALRKFWTVEIRGLDLAEQCAVHYHTLGARGIAVNPTECLIATYCIQKGFELLHDSPGFEPFEQHLGLRVARAS